MATLLLHVENAEGNGRETRAFGPGVVRVGRSRLNDLVLPHPAVSQFHAHIEFDGAAATLVAGRATNAPRLDESVLEPGARVPLAPGRAVVLGPITLRCELSEVPLEDPDAPPAWFADAFAWSRGRAVDERAGTEKYSPSALRAVVAARRAEPVEDPLAAPLARWRAATELLVEAVEKQVAATPLNGREALLRDLGAQHPALRLVPEFLALAEAHAVRWDDDLAARALLRWRQLAHQYGATPPANADELDVLVVRMVRALAALAEGFSALRGALAPWAMASAARSPWEAVTASEGDAPGTLAWLLGDHGGEDRPREVRRVFAELASRPGVLAGAALRGVRALMDRWSPFALEQEMAAIRGLAQIDGEGVLAVWAHWRELYRWWATNERALHDAVFGEAFAAALARESGDRWER